MDAADHKIHSRLNAEKNSAFGKFARRASSWTGKPFTFALAVLVILVWAITGPVFGYSDTWQLVINTGTTIVTFLMVFLIQNSTNRDAEAMQIKLDELLRVQRHANNALLDLEELSEEELDDIREEFLKLAREKRKRDDQS